MTLILISQAGSPQVHTGAAQPSATYALVNKKEAGGKRMFLICQPNSLDQAVII